MSLIVMKFGGECTARPKTIPVLVQQQIAEGHQVALVVSALAGDTDRLFSQMKDAGIEDRHTVADHVAKGEQNAAVLVARVLSDAGIPAQPWRARKFAIPAEGDPVYATVDMEKFCARGEQLLNELFSTNTLPVIAGYQGLNSEGKTVLLGRGGSDTSAVAIGCAIRADYVDFRKNGTNGIHTADPRLVPEARTIPRISYELMQAFAACGAKILAPDSLSIAKQESMALHVSGFSPEARQSTLVTVSDEIPAGRVIGITHRLGSSPGDPATVTTIGKELRLETAGAMAQILAEKDISVIGEPSRSDSAAGIGSITVAISPDCLKRAVSELHQAFIPR